MSSQLIKTLESQLASLKSELEATELYQNIKALERVISINREEGSTEASADSGEHSNRGGRGSSAVLTEMKDAALEFLEGLVNPVSTREILDQLNAHGINVPGENPANNLSAHMSRDSRFISWGRQGWTAADIVVADIPAMQDVAIELAANIPTHELDQIYAKLDAQGSIPNDIDSELLRRARDKLGRHLIDSERQALRKAFRATSSNIIE